MTDPMNDRLTISGRFDEATMLEWARHRARKLSLRSHVVASGPRRIVIGVTGPLELIDAMAVACSLGPADALIDEVRRGNETEVFLT